MAKEGDNNKDSGAIRSDRELAALRARFHATQFRFTAALAAQNGKMSDGVFRIQVKNEFKATKPVVTEQYELIQKGGLVAPEDLCPIEVMEPEVDCFRGTSTDDTDEEELDGALVDPDVLEDLMDRSHRLWLDRTIESDPDLSENEKEGIRKRKKETEERKKKLPLAKATRTRKMLIHPVPMRKSKDRAVEARAASAREVSPPASRPNSCENVMQQTMSAERLHQAIDAPSLEPVKCRDEEDPACTAQEPADVTVRGPDPDNVPTMSAESVRCTPGESAEPLRPRKGSSEAVMPSMLEADKKVENRKLNPGDPTFDTLDNEIVLDDHHLSEIAHGLREGKTFDKSFVTDELKEKLLEIDAKKDEHYEDSMNGVLQQQFAADETATKIVEALTNQEVIAKVVDIEDSKTLKGYFGGQRKADGAVLEALDRVMERILDRADEFYPNQDELNSFLRNRALAKSRLLDAMLSRKGNFLSNLYSSAFAAAQTVMTGVNMTVEAAQRGAVAAVDAVNMGCSIAGQSAIVAKDMATKGTEIVSSASTTAVNVATYSTEQARKVANATALFAGKMGAVMSYASGSSGSIASTPNLAGESSSCGSVTGDTASSTNASTNSNWSTQSSVSTSASASSSLASTVSAVDTDSTIASSVSNYTTNVISATDTNLVETTPLSTAKPETPPSIVTPEVAAPVPDSNVPPLPLGNAKLEDNTVENKVVPTTEGFFSMLWRILKATLLAPYGAPAEVDLEPQKNPKGGNETKDLKSNPNGQEEPTQ